MNCRDSKRATMIVRIGDTFSIHGQDEMGRLKPSLCHDHWYCALML